MTIPERLEQLRKTAGFTQQQVADAINVGYRSYQTYECGRIEPSIATLIALCKLYGITLNDLFAEEMKGLSCPTISQQRQVLIQIRKLVNQL